MTDLVQVSIDEFNAGLLQLSHPETRNALTAEMRERLSEELQRLDADPGVRCIVIAGSDEIFAAGADIRAMAERPLDVPPDPAGMGFWRDIAGLQTPLIAAVSGFALGGG